MAMPRTVGERAPANRADGSAAGPLKVSGGLGSDANAV